MNTTQSIAIPATKNNLFIGSSSRTQYLWKNLVTEKRVTSLDWSRKNPTSNIFKAFWSILSSSAE